MLRFDAIQARVENAAVAVQSALKELGSGGGPEKDVVRAVLTYFPGAKDRQFPREFRSGVNFTISSHFYLLCGLQILPALLGGHAKQAAQRLQNWYQ